MTSTSQIHGSVVALQDRAVLITGAAGSGKSTLCLELIALGATLVADDRVDLVRNGDEIIASAPKSIAGLIEARGVGIMRMTYTASARIAWIVDLDQSEMERLPEGRTHPLLDVPCPVILGKERPGLAAILFNLLRFGRSHNGS